MITNSKMISSIVLSSRHLKELDLLKSFVKNTFLHPNPDFNKVCLNKNSTYEEIYLAGLEKQYYNIILEDNSYFQFNFSEQEDSAEGVITPFARYAFYPNPFINDQYSLAEYYGLYNSGDITFEEYSQVYSESKPLLKKVSIRYDFSCSQYKKIYHPAAHFHFGIAENTRVATDKFFSPLAFTMFIINMYYISDMQKISKDFNLENKYIAEFKNLIKVKSFSKDDIDFYCNLQEELISIK